MNRIGKSEKVIVVFPPPYLDSSPGMGSLVERLAAEGCEVYILTNSSGEYLNPRFKSRRVHYLPVRPKAERGFVWRYLPLSALLGLRAVRLARRIKPAWIIGALPTGLLGATLAKLASGAKSIYFCLELYPSNEAKGWAQKFLKVLEKWANRAVEYTVIQDMYRGRQLVGDHGLNPERVLELPNSRSGQAVDGPSDYLQKRFKIQASDRIALYAGGIAEWSESADLAECALSWPRDWHLVFHSPQIRPGDPYIADLQGLSSNGKIVFSGVPLAQAQMDELVSSAHIGLALYKRGLGLNNYLIGHSAGKICQYLRCGLPVITSDLPSLKNWIDEYQCGICVGGPAEVQEAMDRILSNYPGYQENARRCFLELLKADRYLEEIVLRLRGSD